MTISTWLFQTLHRFKQRGHGLGRPGGAPRGESARRQARRALVPDLRLQLALLQHGTSWGDENMGKFIGLV